MNRKRSHLQWGIIRGLLFWTVLIFLFSGAAETAEWDGSPLTVSRIDIQIEEEYPDDFDWPAMARALIELYVQPGRPLTRENMNSARQALEVFGRLRTEVAIMDGQAVPAFFFNPYKRIKSIRITGNYPVFEREVRQNLSIAAGDIFRPQDMPEQSERIIQLYQRQGFIDPRVDITWKPDRDDNGHQQLRIAIERGPYYQLDDVKLSGNRVMPDLLIKGKLAVWRKKSLWAGTARFEPLQFREDIEKLTAFYRKQGYYDVSISSELTFNEKKHQVNVTITITEGPKYAVIVSGNDSFWDYTLRKDLVLEEIGNLGNKGLRRSTQALRRRYRAAGFADVKIGWENVTGATDQEQRTVIIQIEEGPRHVVERVTISGNSQLKTELIEEQILTRPKGRLRRGIYTEDVLEEDISAIRSLYLQHGFLSTAIDSNVEIEKESAGVAVHLKITEGVQTRVGEVTIAGEAPVPVEDLRAELAMKADEVYRPHLIREEENALSAKISPLGYPHVQVQGTADLSADQTLADLQYAIDTGPLVRLGDLFFAGNFHTRDDFLARETGLKPGQAFSLRQVLEAQRDVRNLGLFDSVQVNSIGLKEQAPRVPLLISMVEKKPYYFELGGGYQNDKGVYGRTKGGNSNLTGTGKDIWLGTEISQVGYRWDAGFGEPRLLGTRFKLDTGLFFERSEPFNQDFGTDTTGGTAAVSRNWGRQYTTSLGLRFERRQQFLIGSASGIDDPAFLEPRSALVTTPAVSYDNRDSFIRPREGLLGFLAVDFSKGLDNELDDFIKYRLDLRWFYPVSEHLVLATRAGVGYLHTYGTTDVLPKDQFFYLGGTTTVRGYAENLLRFDANNNAVGGRLLLLGSVEGRFAVSRSWEVVVFVDTGSIGLADDELGGDDLRWSTGLGLEYITPIGPIGLFYGRKIDTRPNESPGQWHFTIGYTF